MTKNPNQKFNIPISIDISIKTHALGRLKWILDIICYLNQHFNLKNQRNWKKQIWMLNILIGIICILLHWWKKVTLTLKLKFSTTTNQREALASKFNFRVIGNMFGLFWRFDIITSAPFWKWNAPSELVQLIFLYSMCKNKGVTTNEHSIQQISMSNLFDFCKNFPCFANSVPRTLCNWTPTTPPHHKSARLLCSIQCIQTLKV